MNNIAVAEIRSLLYNTVDELHKAKDEKELMRRWIEFYKGTLQNIAALEHPISVIAQNALDVKVLP